MKTHDLLHQKIAVIANGMIHNHEAIAKEVINYDYIIAADGGLAHCDQMEITPDLIIGDLDSAHSELLKKFDTIPTKRFPEDKDKTDIELALEEALSLNPNIVSLFGALERRTDHSLYNLHLIRRHPGKVVIQSEFEKISVVSRHQIIPCRKGQTLSLISIGGVVKGITTKGLKWELNDVDFDHHFMSISNVCLGDEVEIRIDEGDLLCCMVYPS